MAEILVAYDGSESSRRALDRAITEARDSHARITVLSVAEMPLNPNDPRYFGTLDDLSAEDGPLAPTPEVLEHLTEARTVLREAGIDADFAWSAGDPGREIVDTAKQVGARTIVLGEHHHGFLSSLFGNVDEEVQKEAGCNVILA
jgi:nucleotide-binding universal stress UspA family protein